METKNLLERIADFLGRHRPLWAEEVLIRYPDRLSVFPDEWLDQFSKLTEKELYQLEREKRIDLLSSPSLIEYYQQADQLVRLQERITASEKRFPDRAFYRVSEKKRHEITRLAQIVSELVQEKHLAQVIDLCGGVGYLAQLLSHHYSIPTSTLDFDHSLQEIGQSRHLRYRPAESAPLTYINHDLSKDKEQVLSEITSPHLCLGLHTCGSLAIDQIMLSLRLESPVVFNFSCCYYKSKMDLFNISHSAKNLGVELTEPALTLASRSHQEGEKAYYFSKRVKLYRYMIHLFLHHELGIKSFLSLGKSAQGLYRGEFVEYALEQLHRLDLPTSTEIRRRLQSFFLEKKHQASVNRLIHANIIRTVAGRLIELYIIADRAMFLEEHGYQTSVASYFEQAISPRNIGILACKEN